MIPSHILDDLAPTDRVAVLSRGGEIHFLVHPASDDPDVIRSSAAREGSEVLTTHMRDHTTIRAFVASRERAAGGRTGPSWWRPRPVRGGVRPAPTKAGPGFA